MDTVRLLSGSSNSALATEVADYLGVALGDVKLSTFPDGEISVEILEDVQGKDVFLFQSVVRRPQYYLCELLLMIDALKRSSARSIVPVIPYHGYGRQDRRNGKQVPITAKLMADLLQKAGATQVVTMDLHAKQIQGFYDIPVANLEARPLLTQALNLQGNWVVGCPDIGSIKTAHAYARELGLEMVFVDKERISSEEVAGRLIGQVKDKHVLLVDDMCSTGNTLIEAAKLCQEAESIAAVVSHGLFVGDALERLKESPIERIWTTNSVPGLKNVEIVSVAPLFGEAIRQNTRELIWN